MRGCIDSSGQTRSDREASRGQIFGEPFGAIDAVTGWTAGSHNRHLRQVGIPPFSPYIKDDGRIEYLPQKTGVIGMEDVQDADAQRFGLFPFFRRAVCGPRRQHIIRDLGRNPIRFQFLPPAVQYRFGRSKPAQQRMDRAVAEASHEREAQHR